MDVKSKGVPGIYTKVYGYVPEDAQTKTIVTEKGNLDLMVFDLVYETGSLNKETKRPVKKGIRCEVLKSKLNGESIIAGTKLEVGGPLRIDYNKEKEKTYVSLKVLDFHKE